jgi:hypothetical protein
MITPGRLRWGLLFITIGAMLLLNNAGALSWEYWPELLVWWPLILIAVGIEKIFQKTSLQFISYLSPLILIVAMIYIAVETGSDGSSRGFFSAQHWSERYDPSVASMDAVIEHGGIDLYINRETDDLATARFERFSRKPKIKFSKNDGTARLEIRRGFWRGSGFFIIDGKHGGRDWNINFSDVIPLSLNCLGENSKINLNLESIPAEAIKIDNEEGEIYLKIGDLRPEVSVEIRGKDADFRLRIPDEAGIKVASDEYHGYMKSLALDKVGDFYQTEGFDTLKVRVFLKLDNDLRRLKIERY